MRRIAPAQPHACTRFRCDSKRTKSPADAHGLTVLIRPTSESLIKQKQPDQGLNRSNPIKTFGETYGILPRHASRPAVATLYKRPVLSLYRTFIILLSVTLPANRSIISMNETEPVGRDCVFCSDQSEPRFRHS